jgi:protein O-mannosyl-transferase
VLSMFFALLSLLAYVEYARRGHNRLYAVCVVAFVLALLAKPVAVSLPIVMLLLDYWPLRRLNWVRVRDKFQLLGIGAVFAFLAYISQMSTVGTRYFEHKTPIDRPLAMLHNNMFYLEKAFWPADLYPFYPIPNPMDWLQTPIRVGVIGTPILLVLLLISWRWTRAAVTGWAIFLITLLPTMGVVRFTPVIAADRFLYLPMLGLLLPLTAGLGWLWTRTRSGSHHWVSRAAIMVLMAAAATACAAATRRQLCDWQDTLTINQAVLEHVPQSTHAHHNLAVELGRRGELGKAIEQYQMALRIDPESGSSQYGLAVALFQQRRLPEALREFQRSFELSPHRPEVRCGLASALAELGRRDEACTVLDECLRMFPDCAVAHTNLGQLQALGTTTEGREQALRHLSRAVELEPRNVAYRYNLADFLAARGQFADAIAHYQRVLELDPSHEAARAGLLRAQQALKR